MEEIKSRTSLGQMMELLRDMDEGLLPEEFDPAAIIRDVREEVDAIQYQLLHWEYEIKKRIEEVIKPHQAIVSSMEKKHAKLTSYVLSEMIRLNVEKIPGDIFRVQIQKKPPAVEIKAEANAQMYLNYPEIVVQDISYRWDKTRIKELIDSGESYTFASMAQGKKAVFKAKGDTK